MLPVRPFSFAVRETDLNLTDGLTFAGDHTCILVGRLPDCLTETHSCRKRLSFNPQGLTQIILPHIWILLLHQVLTPKGPVYSLTPPFITNISPFCFQAAIHLDITLRGNKKMMGHITTISREH